MEDYVKLRVEKRYFDTSKSSVITALTFKRGQRMTVGTSSLRSIKLNKPKIPIISRDHGQFYFEGPNLFYANNSKNGTWDYDAQEFIESDRIILTKGKMLGFGNTQQRAPLTKSDFYYVICVEKITVVDAKVCLVVSCFNSDVSDIGYSTEEFCFEDYGLQIGRDPRSKRFIDRSGADLFLNGNDLLSKKHGSICLEKGVWYYKDNSTNGTVLIHHAFVANSSSFLHNKKHSIRKGDLLVFGSGKRRDKSKARFEIKIKHLPFIN